MNGAFAIGLVLQIVTDKLECNQRVLRAELMFPYYDEKLETEVQRRLVTEVRIPIASGLNDVECEDLLMRAVRRDLNEGFGVYHNWLKAQCTPPPPVTCGVCVKETPYALASHLGYLCPSCSAGHGTERPVTDRVQAALDHASDLLLAEARRLSDEGLDDVPLHGVSKPLGLAYACAANLVKKSGARRPVPDEATFDYGPPAETTTCQCCLKETPGPTTLCASCVARAKSWGRHG